jgi:tetratricopeptide (TPR) repeat protein
MNRHTAFGMVMSFSLLAAAGLAQSADPAATLAAARQAYGERADAARAAAALDGFAAAAGADVTSYPARWEGARASYYLGTWARPGTPDRDKMAIFQHGIDLARQAIALQPRGVEGHFWLGVLLGVYGEAKGIFKSLALVPDIKREMAVCLEIDPAVEGYGPDRVMGRMLYKLPFFKGGDNAQSAQRLERSIKGEPANALTRLYLAETYKSLGQKPKAIAQLRQVIDMQPDPRWAPEHPAIKAQAQALLAKLQ